MNGASGVQLPEGNERAEKNSAINRKLFVTLCS